MKYIYGGHRYMVVSDGRVVQTKATREEAERAALRLAESTPTVPALVVEVTRAYCGTTQIGEWQPGDDVPRRSKNKTPDGGDTSASPSAPAGS